MTNGDELAEKVLTPLPELPSSAKVTTSFPGPYTKFKFVAVTEELNVIASIPVRLIGAAEPLMTADVALLKVVSSCPNVALANLSVSPDPAPPLNVKPSGRPAGTGSRPPE